MSSPPPLDGARGRADDSGGDELVRVIIAGMPRSGTTLLAAALNGLPGCTFITDYVTCFEQAAVHMRVGYATPLASEQRRAALLLAREQFLGLGHPVVLGAGDFGCLDELHAEVTRGFAAAGDRVVGHKTVLSPARLQRVLHESDVHLVLLYRDPRDAALSFWYRTGSGVEDYLADWRAHVRLARAQSGHPRLHVLRYEAMVERPRATLAPLFESLGLTDTAGLGRLRPLRATRGPQPAWAPNTAHHDVRRAFDGAPVGRWRAYRDSPVVRYASWCCRAEIARLGYGPGPAGVGRREALHYALRLRGAGLERALDGGANWLSRQVIRRCAPPITHGRR